MYLVNCHDIDQKIQVHFAMIEIIQVLQGIKMV